MSNAVARMGQGQQFGAAAGNRSVTTTAAGALIPEEAMFVEITSPNANYAAVLPSAQVGRVLHGYVGPAGFELWTRSTGQTINGTECFADNELAIPTTSHFEAVCVSAGDWIVSTRTLAGANVDVTPDAR